MHPSTSRRIILVNRMLPEGQRVRWDEPTNTYDIIDPTTYEVLEENVRLDEIEDRVYAPPLAERRAQELARLKREHGANGAPVFAYRQVLSQYCDVKQYNYICERSEELS